MVPIDNVIEKEINERFEREYKVYKHICPNGKVYIGITCNDVKYRWWGGKGYRGSLFGKAIAEFGWDSIEHVVSKGCYSQERACELEIKLIAKYRSNNLEYGYNVTAGGNGSLCVLHTDKYKQYMSKMYTGTGNPMYGVEVTQEHRDKISKANTGKVFTEEHKAKIGASNKNKNTGKHASEEARKKMSEAGKGRITSQETKIKMSLAAQGRKMPQAAKDKLSKRIISQETKDKISVSQKKRLALRKERGDVVASH